MKKIAVVLFNLGGPDKLESVEPFLFNLFNDPAIINLPKPLRWLVAKLISKRRTPEAQSIYQHLGGKSPLLEQTQAQAEALEQALKADKSADYKVFIAMRYWHPRAQEIFKKVQDYNPTKVILLPLYPQYSTTTSGSSLKEWKRLTKERYPSQAICCYPALKGFTHTLAKRVDQAVEKAKAYGRPRVLFTAHGLPKKTIEKGDPYQNHVLLTVEKIKAEMATLSEADPVVCYQSRVGPLEWIKPYTDDEIRKAGEAKAPLVMVPVAFVSEHSETLVELDIEYKDLAKDEGVPFYERVSTVQDTPAFIDGLKSLVMGQLKGGCDGCYIQNRCCFKNTY